MELRDAAGRYELLEKENQAKAADLKKALDSAKETLKGHVAPKCGFGN